jgi:hypothetical protein
MKESNVTRPGGHGATNNPAKGIANGLAGIENAAVRAPRVRGAAVVRDLPR